MTVDVIVRPASATDFSPIFDLMQASQALHHRWQPEQMRPEVIGFTLAIFQGRLTEPDQLHLAADIGAGVAGYAWASRMQGDATEIIYPRKYVHVGLLLVSDDYRRLGIGGALMEAIEAWAVDFGAEHVSLNVDRLNDGARAFYDHTGYTTLREYRSKPLRHVPRHSKTP